MDPTLAVKARAALSLSADAVPDERLDDAVAERALALSADATTLATERDALKASVAALTAERDEAKAKADAEGKKVLALSADDPASLSPINLGAFEMNADMLWENAIKAGAISVADAGKVKSLLRSKEGRPTRLALSASGENSHPLEFNLARLLGGLATPLRTGHEKPGDVTEAQRLELDATEREKPADPKELAEARRLAGLPEKKSA